jgi:outer membrane protein assembly factor BamD
MEMKRELLFSFLMIVGLVFLLSGCSLLTGFFPKKQSSSTPEGSYNNAMLLLNKKKYEEAAKEFRAFKEQYPLSELTTTVEMRLADSLFFDKKYLEAFFQYEEFKKLHPIHQEIPYATYQMAMCHFKQILSVDRDQAQTHKSIELFRVVAENYPQSPYAEQARGKIAICQRQLADHEFYIGNFYLKKKKYRAALGRFEGILQKYPNSGLETKLQQLISKCRTEILREEKNRQVLEDPADKKKMADERNRMNRNASIFWELEKPLHIKS